MKLYKLLLTTLFVFLINNQFLSAQEIDVQNRTESLSSFESRDLNSITTASVAITKRTIKKKKEVTKKSKKELSIKELEKLVNRNRLIRTRHKRNVAEKCYKETDEENSCASADSNLKDHF